MQGFRVSCLLAAAVGFSPPASADSPPQGIQNNVQFASSYATSGVASVSATTQRVSCYAPELAYFGILTAEQGYVDGGMSPCNGQATTGEDIGPYPSQDVRNPPMRVKDHSESDLRVDPTCVSACNFDPLGG